MVESVSADPDLNSPSSIFFLRTSLKDEERAVGGERRTQILQYFDPDLGRIRHSAKCLDVSETVIPSAGFCELWKLA